MSNNRTMGYIFMGMGVMLLASALLLFFHNRRTDEKAGAEAARIYAVLESMLEEERLSAAETEEYVPQNTENLPGTDTGTTEAVTETVPAEETLSLEELYAPTEDTLPTMAEVEIGGYGYIGVLEIPALSLSLPVIGDCDMEKLKTAPCRQFGSVDEGNLVIAGHNYRRHFGYLTEIRIGDVVQFSDMAGNVFVYTVAEIEELAATDVEAMKNSGWDLTLYTCNYTGNKRLTVRCMRAEKETS